MALIDSLDAKIIRLLQEDGRQPNTAIARKLGTAEATVRKRIDRLLREEIIQVGAWADPLKVGYQTYAYIQISVAPGKVDSAIKALAALPEIAFLAVCAGPFDMIAAVFLRSNDHMYEFLTERMLKVPGIVSTTTISMLRVVKRDVTFEMSAIEESFDRPPPAAKRANAARRGKRPA